MIFYAAVCQFTAAKGAILLSGHYKAVMIEVPRSKEPCLYRRIFFRLEVNHYLNKSPRLGINGTTGETC